jgi:UDP-N-acetyl-D-glucosamine dehydrogenase
VKHSYPEVTDQPADSQRPVALANAASAAVSSFEALHEKIERGTAVVGIIGLGYVGLPLAEKFCRRFRVLGFDIDSRKVATLNRGESYIGHIPAKDIVELRERGFEATDAFDRLREPDVIIVCVPTPLTATRDPDLAYVVGSAEAIAARLRPGQLVVLESTTYPGTTREVVRPILESARLRLGTDFFLAFSPEREDPGNSSPAAKQIPRVVGGLDPRSAELAQALYGAAGCPVVPVTSCEVAESCKILENIYRAVNIALVNEMKVLFNRMGIDIWEVIDAARTKPFGFQAFQPGPGLGGHCIPVDPFYLTWLAHRYGMATRFIELAGEVNTSMPAYVVGRLADALNDRGRALNGSRVTLLGMAYKRDVDDPRESPGFELIRLLEEKKAIVNYNDPHIPRLPPMRHHPGMTLDSQTLTAEYLAAQDCVLIVTDHSKYDWPWIVRQSRLVVDTRNATRDVTEGREKIVRA